MTKERTRCGTGMRHRPWGAPMGAVLFGISRVAATSESADARPHPGGKETREYADSASLPWSVVYDRRIEAFYGGSISDGTLYWGTLDDPTSEFFLPAGVLGGRPRRSPRRPHQAVGVNVDGEGRMYVACLDLRCWTPAEDLAWPRSRPGSDQHKSHRWGPRKG